MVLALHLDCFSKRLGHNVITNRDTDYSSKSYVTPIAVGSASIWSQSAPEVRPVLFILYAALCKAKYYPGILWI